MWGRGPDVSKLAARGDVRGLAEAVRGTDPAVQVEAARALAEVGGPIAVEALAGCLGEGTSEVRAAVIDALVNLGSISADTLMAHLTQAGTPERSDALWALASIKDPLCVESVIACLREGGAISICAAETLGEIGDPRAIEPLGEAIRANSGDMLLHLEVVKALAKIHSVRVVGPLLSALVGPSSDACRMAAKALVNVGSEAVKPLTAVIQSGTTPDPIRGKVAGVLGDIGDRSAVPSLVAYLGSDGEPHWRAYAAQALGEIGDREAFSPLLLAMQTDDDGGVQRYAAGALALVGGPDAVDYIIEAITHLRGGVDAIDALGNLADPRAVESLAAVLEDQNCNTLARMSAAGALGKIGGERSIGVLRAASRFEDDGDEDERLVRAKAARALGELEGSAS